MFVDVSALTAILIDEPEAHSLVARLQRARRRMTSPLAVWETAVAVARHLDLTVPDARDAVRANLDHAGIRILAVPSEAADGALAYDRFGKGRHPAGLTFSATVSPTRVPGPTKSLCSTRATISPSPISRLGEAWASIAQTSRPRAENPQSVVPKISATCGMSLSPRPDMLSTIR